MTLSEWSIIKAHGHLGPTAIRRLYLPHVTVARIRLVWRKLGFGQSLVVKASRKPPVPWGTYPSHRRKRPLHPRNALYCRRYKARIKAARQAMAAASQQHLSVSSTLPSIAA